MPKAGRAGAECRTSAGLSMSSFFSMTCLFLACSGHRKTKDIRCSSQFVADQETSRACRGSLRDTVGSSVLYYGLLSGLWISCLGDPGFNFPLHLSMPAKIIPGIRSLPRAPLGASLNTDQPAWARPPKPVLTHGAMDLEAQQMRCSSF
jgi:hypothetical protein